MSDAAGEAVPDRQRYDDAAHAMQTGVAFMLAKDPADCTPKHLRVGINSAHVSQAAIARILIQKGIITGDEYVKALADEMEAEAERYRTRIDPTGRIRLG